MKIVFFGTPNYVLPILESLYKNFKGKITESPISAVVTQGPKPFGRKQILEYSPVDTWAYKKKIPIYFQSREIVDRKIEADIGILASYGEIIPTEVLNYFKYGILNVHPSLLPKYRGASPIQAAILSGDKVTGVSIIKLDEILDHGPIISQFKEDILDNDTAETLRSKLFERSAEVLSALIPAYMAGKITPKIQNDESASFTRQIKKEDGYIDPQALQSATEGKTLRKKWNIVFFKDFIGHYSPITIHQYIRAMNPWPIAWTEIKLKVNDQWSKKRVRVLKAHLDTSSTINHQPLLIIDSVQLEGKSPVSWKQFLEGYPEAEFINK